VRFVRRLLGAVLLGFATLFERKVRPEDHWATSPVADVAEDEQGQAGSSRSQRLP
jgi:hypothetical protein